MNKADNIYQFYSNKNFIQYALIYNSNYKKGRLLNSSLPIILKLKYAYCIDLRNLYTSLSVERITDVLSSNVFSKVSIDFKKV